MGGSSDRSMKEETGCQQQTTEIHCANGCGFFGSASTMNLCSKCYRDYQNKELQTTSAQIAVEKSLNPKKSLQQTNLTKSKCPFSFANAGESPTSSSDSISSASDNSPVDVKPGSGLKNRCSSCNKRVGLTGFKCRCGFTYCSSHRYPEEHSCTFDFKGSGRDAIAKANPVIKADKIERF